MTWFILVLVGLFLILRALRRPARPLPRTETPFVTFDVDPAPADMDAPWLALDPEITPAPVDAPPSPAASSHRRIMSPPPARDWKAQFDRTLHGPGLCSPK